MKNRQLLTRFGKWSLPLMVVLLLAVPALAHCDAIDGPVVKAAQKALATSDVNLVLVWVRKQDEPDIRKAFERTMSVRKLSPVAQELADTFFFETLVRIHRAGEGAPYTGLKPAGRDPGPAISVADQVLTAGSADSLVKLITDEARKGLIERFELVRKSRNYATTDLEAGREYVRAYVEFIHYAERLYDAATQDVMGHSPDTQHTTQRRQ